MTKVNATNTAEAERGNWIPWTALGLALVAVLAGSPWTLSVVLGAPQVPANGVYVALVFIAEAVGIGCAVAALRSRRHVAVAVVSGLACVAMLATQLVLGILLWQLNTAMLEN